LALLAPPDPVRGGKDFLYVHAFDLALGTGLRFGELRALRFSDIHLQRNLLRVEKAYVRRSAAGCAGGAAAAVTRLRRQSP
jgi:integrase